MVTAHQADVYKKSGWKKLGMVWFNCPVSTVLAEYSVRVKIRQPVLLYCCKEIKKNSIFFNFCPFFQKIRYWRGIGIKRARGWIKRSRHWGLTRGEAVGDGFGVAGGRVGRSSGGRSGFSFGRRSGCSFGGRSGCSFGRSGGVI